MNQTLRTLIFAGLAVISVSAAVATHYATRPEPIEQFALVGEPFYPKFTDPADARALEVAALDPQTGKLQTFGVEYADGLWRIPSHHNYPAEAQERLADTAASIIGITREALAGRRENQHARFGVADPKDDAGDDPEAAGRRITLRDSGGKVLADYIIGKPIEEQSDPQFVAAITGDDEDTRPLHYVRLPNEDETYVARVEVDVRTRFGDWIEQDLLKSDEANFVDLTFHTHSFVEVQQGPFIIKRHNPEGDTTLHLTNKDGTWQLEGLDDATEEFDSSSLWQLTSALKELQIVGVRPRPKLKGEPLLTPELRISPPEKSVTQGEFEDAIQDLQIELTSLGFVLAQDQSDEERLQLLSEEGELIAATDQGVVYHLHFGNALVGDEQEIEIGGGGSSEKATKKETNEADAADTGADEEAQRPNRYLYLRVEFDPQFLGEQPVEPTKPTPPKAETKPDDETDSGGAPERSATDPEADSPSDENGEEPGPPADEKPAEDAATPDPQAEYEAALARYEQDLQDYQDQLQQFEGRRAEGQRQVRALNERYADWYYVISSESFDDLRLTRDELVKPKEEPKETPPEDSATDPTNPNATEPPPPSPPPSPPTEPGETADPQPENPAPPETGDRGEP